MQMTPPPPSLLSAERENKVKLNRKGAGGGVWEMGEVIWKLILKIVPPPTPTPGLCTVRRASRDDCSVVNIL